MSIEKITYEILAKWVGHNHGLTIEFKDDVTPVCNPKERKITLPSNLADKNIDATIAATLHEAGHIRRSDNYDRAGEDNTMGMARDKMDHELLNVMEDMHVDNYAMDLLPNIKSFYKKLYADSKDGLDESKVPPLKKALSNIYLSDVGLDDMRLKDDPEALKIERMIENDMWGLKYDSGKTDILKRLDGIKTKIRKYYKDAPPPPPSGASKPGDGPCSPAQAGDAQGSGQGNGDKDVKGSLPSAPGIPDDQLDGDGVKPGFGTCKTETNKEDGYVQSSASVDLSNATRETFKRLLDTKCKKKKYNGIQLDTGALTSFCTGSLDTLFTEVIKVKKKKSFIGFLLDASGSMHAGMLRTGDESAYICRNDVVADCMEELEKVLKEVKGEGADVNHKIYAYCTHLIQLNQETWRSDYMMHGGGTRILPPFEEVIKEVSTMGDVDGEKILICFTDGCIARDEIDGISKLLGKYGSDVRIMFIGVGNTTNAFTKKFLHPNIIMAQERSSEVLMQAINNLLSSY
jgi:hypothetical protein